MKTTLFRGVALPLLRVKELISNYVSGDFKKCRAFFECNTGTLKLQLGASLNRAREFRGYALPQLNRNLTNLGQAVIRVLFLSPSFRTWRSSVAFCERAALLTKTLSPSEERFLPPRLAKVFFQGGSGDYTSSKVILANLHFLSTRCPQVI